MNESSKKMGKNMKRIRLEKGMTQGDICRKLGLDRAYISNLENGKKNPTLATIDKLASALGIGTDTLLK
jgi:transcriptional regulator with XRE-family HTH domain